MVPGLSWRLLSASRHLSAAPLRSTPIHSLLSQSLCTLPLTRINSRGAWSYLSIPASPGDSGLWWEQDRHGVDPNSVWEKSLLPRNIRESGTARFLGAPSKGCPSACDFVTQKPLSSHLSNIP